jgi:hypothetical protein
LLALPFSFGVSALFDPYDETSRNRLFKAVEASYREIEPFRRLSRTLVEEYVGPDYGGSRKGQYEQILQLSRQAATANTITLAANRPRVLMTTEMPELRLFAKKFQSAINNLTAEIHLEEVLQRWVLDAYFCVGFIKVHTADSGQVMLERGIWMDPGRPFASNVHLDDMVFDVTAKEWQYVRFAGDLYRLPFEDLKDPNLFDQDEVAELHPNSKYNSFEDDRMQNLSRGTETDPDDIEPMIDMIDLWLPACGCTDQMSGEQYVEPRICTFAVDRQSHKISLKGGPLACLPSDYPEGGPYHKLGFGEVPENIMPLGEAAGQSPLSRLANNLIRKQARQAKRQKDNPIYTPSGADSAKKIQRASDGDWVEVNDVNDVSLLKQGGVDPGNHAFFLGVLKLFDNQGGNLSAKLGLGPSAETAKQEQLITAALGTTDAAKQINVMRGTVGVIRDLGYMLWMDQTKVIPGAMTLSSGYKMDATWTPEDREGDFFDYNFQIDVYSMRYKSPEERAESLHKILTSVFLPMAPLLAQQGGNIDMREITETFAELMQEPRVKNWFVFNPMPQQPVGGGGGGGGGPPQPQQPGMPQQSRRDYVRHNVPAEPDAQAQWMEMAQQGSV